MKKTLQKAVKAAASLVLSLALLVSGSVSASALLLEKGGIYVADYPSTAEAMEAANKLNTLLSAEGDVLLKNDGTLPLFGDEKISVFGGMQRNPVGASGTGLLAVLREEGFDVNPVLEGFYSSNGSIGSERLNFSAEQEQSLDLYHDAALIVLSRTGGEGADLAMVTNEAEDNTDGDGNVYDWTHESLGLKEDVEYKHYLELTDSEEALISYVKARFDRIIVIINTSNAMELANLQEDDDINAIVWIGRPGSTGLKALAQILSGEVNPSGRLVDEWYRDFTADPTWENFGSNSQVGISYDYIYNVEGAPNGLRGIDYDEGIYVGYKYYETVFAEIAAGNLGYDAETKRIVKEGGETGPEAAEAWWSYAVVYPFGYGLSYTTFEESFEKLYYLEDGKKVDLEGTVDGDDLFSSAAGSEAKVKELYADVKVTNTGAMAGKQVVQIYVTAPYTVGGIEKAGVTLVGFAKTAKIRPGQSQVVTVKFNVQDMASFDYNDVNANEFFGYELEAGEYIVKVMEDSHRVADEKSFTLETGATLALDDFSGNEIDNVFSKGDMFDTIRKNNDPENPDSPLNVNVSNEAGQLLLSRADLSTEAVLALRPTVEEQTLSDAFVKSVMFWIDFTSADQTRFADDQDATAITGAEHFYWYKTDDELKELMAGWSQAAAHEEGYTDVETKMKDMSGVDIHTEEGRAAWTAFMNQLTWDEIKSIDNRGGHTTVAVPSIGKVASKDENGPNSYMGKSWCDATVLASTWNVDLARQYGILNANLGMLGNTIQEGWYGPGMDLHRTPFGGRNNEYYSQDGIQGGIIGAAQVGGAQSRGLNVYIKHMFMNDQESSRQGLFTWVSEQAIREIYAKAFQMCMQEGGSTSAMTAFNRIGAIDAIMCEPMLIRMVRDEWGWDGQYVTDFYTAVKSRHMDLLIRSGNDLPDGTASGQYAVSGTWKADAVGLGTADAPAGNVIFGEGDDAKESLLQWYYARVCAERVLYVAANTLNNRNGVDTTAQNLSFELAQGVAAEDISIALSEEALNGNPVTYSVTGGALPEGLSLNANTGAITGTPTGSGSSSVTITAAIAGWLKSTIRASFDISSAFKLVQFEGDKEVVKDQFAGKVGEAFEGFIDSDVVTAEQFNQGIRYEVADGYALPKGLALGEGLIEGTPEEAGTFDVVINLVGTNQTGSGRNARTTTSRFAIPVTIVIEEGEGGAEGGIQLRVSEGYLQFTTDGETWTNLITIEALKEFLK